jgi:hypothetical protein
VYFLYIVIDEIKSLPAEQCVLQKAIIEIKFAAGITVCSTGIINESKAAHSNAVCSTDAIIEVKCAASNSLYSRVPFIKSSLLPTM